jgi:hypothetical protein
MRVRPREGMVARMSDAAPAFAPVLGHARVLREAAGDPLRRVVAGDDPGRLAGIAAYEPLFGRHAEGVVALADGVEPQVAEGLFHDLLARTTAEGLVLIHFVLLPAQAALATMLAATVTGATIGPELTVPLR